MQKSLKVLLYLSPDEAYVEDIANYTYGPGLLTVKDGQVVKVGGKESELDSAVLKVRGVMSHLISLGWQVYRRKNCYKLSEEHYLLVQSTLGKGKWHQDKAMTPKNVKKDYSVRKKLQSIAEAMKK